MEDNYSIWLAHEDAMEAEIERLPVCSECREHIQDETFIEVHGMYLCNDCIDNYHVRFTDDYMR